MAVVHRVKRIANPRGRRVKHRRTAVVRNSKGRFVRVRKTARRRVRKAAPKRRHVTARRVIRRRANPVLIELGALNPHHFGSPKRRKRTVARKIRRNARRRVRAANPRRRRHVARRVVRRRRRSPVVVVSRRRRPNPRRHHSRRRIHHRRPNPAAFGQSGKNLLLMTGGVLVGVAATKYLPTLIPASITGMFGASPVVSTLITVAGAFAAQFIAKKVMSNTAFSDAVLLGGLALAGSRALDAFAPPQLSQALALSGIGDIVPGYFSVPQNSVTNRAPAPQMMVATKGVGRAFGGGFGNRR